MSSRPPRHVLLLGAVVSAALVVSSPASAEPLSAPSPVTARSAAAAAAAAAGSPTRFTVSSFNVLGSSHTRGRGGFASGVARSKGVARVVRKHSADVVGFQEMQRDQMRGFIRRTHKNFGLFPGLRRREIDGENSLAWRKSQFRLVSARTVNIPYFKGRKRQMPVIKLQSRATGTTAWFANFHNPAHKRYAKARKRAIRIEVRLARKLHRTGLPVFITGDMNERERVFCPMTGNAPMKAARGGSHGAAGCRANNPWYVDWVFGSRKRVAFGHYKEDTSRLVKRTTDHPVIVTDVRLPAR